MKKLFGIVLALSVGTLLAQNTWQAMFPKNNNVAAATTSTTNPYLFPLVGTGLVDVWRFDALSGNIISSVKGHTYTVTEAYGGQYSYRAVGPNGIYGITHPEDNGGHIKIASQADTDFDIGAGENFTLMMQFTPNNTNNDGRALIDLGSGGGNNSGLYVLLTGDFRIAIYLLGAGSTGFSRTDVNTISNGTFYTLRVVFDRSTQYPKYYLKAQGGSETLLTVSGSTNLTTLGAVTITSDPVSFVRNSSNGDSPWWGQLWQFAYAKGTAYDVTIKP